MVAGCHARASMLTPLGSRRPTPLFRGRPRETNQATTSSGGHTSFPQTNRLWRAKWDSLHFRQVQDGHHCDSILRTVRICPALRGRLRAHTMSPRRPRLCVPEYGIARRKSIPNLASSRFFRTSQGGTTRRESKRARIAPACRCGCPALMVCPGRRHRPSAARPPDTLAVRALHRSLVRFWFWLSCRQDVRRRRRPGVGSLAGGLEAKFLENGHHRAPVCESRL